MEIVTEPDIRTAEQARRYAEELQLLLRLRYRLRVDLGLGEDDYDRMLDGTPRKALVS